MIGSAIDSAIARIVGRALMVLVVLVAIAQQARLGLDCDVSWLLTVAERVLDGARLYRDVMEVNPPASVLLYMPMILAGRASGIGADAATLAGVFVAAAALICVTGRSLAHDGLIARPQCPAMAIAAAFAFLVLPGACFAQREHVAVLIALPALAVIARRAGSMATPRRFALLAGTAGGVAIAIKPHFALAFLLPIAVAAVRRRSLSAMLGPEILGATAVVAGYAIVVLAVFPDYLTMLPTLRAVYLPLREDPVTLLRGPVVIVPLALGALAWWVGGRHIGIVPAILMAAGLGFAIAGVVQGKGYLNHAYPAAALGFLAVVAILSGAGPFRRSRGIAVAASLALAALEWHAFAGIAGHPGLAEAIGRVAPPHPRIIALSSEIGVGHPLVRQIGGRWIGRSGALWAAGGAAARLATGDGSPEERRRLAAIARTDEAAFGADVRRGRPDVLLIDASAAGWRREPGIAAVLQSYRSATRVGDVEVWTRRLRHASDCAFIAARFASPAATARAMATACSSAARAM